MYSINVDWSLIASLIIIGVSGSLKESIDGLENDCDFLLKGSVFTEDLIDTYIKHKRLQEIDQVALRPHPWEYSLYYEI